jgi:hypothetical protein
MKNALTFLALATAVLQTRGLNAQSCLGADTSSARIIARVQAYVTGASTGAAQTRAMLHLPSLVASQVTLLTDEASCVRARQAQDSLVHATNPDSPAVMPVRGLYVVKLGTYNALVDPCARSQGEAMLGFFDPNWAYLGSTPIYIGWPVVLPMQNLPEAPVAYHAHAAGNDTADMQSEVHINHTAVGALTGLAVGSTVGFLLGRNKDRDCQEGPCGATLVFGIEFGVLGAVVGGIIGSQWPSAAQKAGMISFDRTRKQGLRLKISLRR